VISPENPVAAALERFGERALGALGFVACRERADALHQVEPQPHAESVCLWRRQHATRLVLREPLLRRMGRLSHVNRRQRARLRHAVA